MVETASRSLRDGVLPGEFAPALMLLNRSSTPHPARVLLLHFLGSLSSNIVSGAAQAKQIVLVAADRNPQFYHDFKGFTEDQLSRFYFVDCFVDPLGWRKILGDHQLLEEVTVRFPHYKVCHDVKDLDSLLMVVLQAGAEKAEAVKFAVVIDSISSLLAYNSLESVAKFINNLRSNGIVSSLVWMLHSELHDAKVMKSFEYISSMNISIEQLKAAVRQTDKSLQMVANKCFSEGILTLRHKRRNGRVREQVEKFEVHGSTMTFSKTEGTEAAKVIVPQVQFRLQLTDKERQERAKVILPFEHQGEIRVYILPVKGSVYKM
ncbi:hypothetical protein KP509_23G017400 [Ceratopteris richardii]|uniref:Elongator complex protein 5 n=1 Tax=Ceratopteris richardii TaxID=49495 RepID=A0A8T2S027_CERRI|nr:hypothetical protein KP509_23G017400 [Ceratopteris richardii]